MMPGGLRCIIGYTAQDYAKTLHGKALTINTSDIYDQVLEAIKSELVCALAEAGLIRPDTEYTQGPLG